MLSAEAAWNRRLLCPVLDLVTFDACEANENLWLSHAAKYIISTAYEQLQLTLPLLYASSAIPPETE